MKLYVWENVLCDWTCGIAFALANSLEEAIKLVSDYYNKGFGWEGEEYQTPYFVSEEPKIYDVPVGYAIWGGG